MTNELSLNKHKHIEDLKNENKELESKIEENSKDINDKLTEKRNKILELELEIEQLEKDKKTLPENQALINILEKNKVTLQFLEVETKSTNVWIKKNNKVYSPGPTTIKDTNVVSGSTPTATFKDLPKVELGEYTLDFNKMIKKIEEWAKTVKVNGERKSPTVYCLFDSKCHHKDCGYAHFSRGEHALLGDLYIGTNRNDYGLTVKTFHKNVVNNTNYKFNYQAFWESAVLTLLYDFKEVLANGDNYLHFNSERRSPKEERREPDDNVEVHDCDTIVVQSEEVEVETE